MGQSQDIYTSLMCTWEMKFGLGESVVLSVPVPRHDRVVTKGHLWNRGSFIKYMRKIFRKTNISYPLISYVCVRIRGKEILLFRKILLTHLRNDPLV